MLKFLKSFQSPKEALFKAGKKNLLIIGFSFFILCVLFGIALFRDDTQSISTATFERLLEQNLISEAYLKNDEILLKSGDKHYTIVKDAIDVAWLAQKMPVKKLSSNYLLQALCAVLLIIIIYLLKIKNPKVESQAQLLPTKTAQNTDTPSIKPAISKIKFTDIAGVDEVKIELAEIVDFLKNPKKYKEFGVKMPKGVLMVGPPGVGKTLIAKAVAGEASVPFFYQSGSSFVEIYVGMGAKRVRELFSRAKAMSPSIIFIDEIDAVGKARGEVSNVERDSTLNQLLTQMDGFEDNSGVIVIAATNKIELMDPALLRSGRFDRRIFISLPDYKDRLKILEIYMKDKKNNVNLSHIAKASVGFSGAALETLVNEAAINALRRDALQVEENDFFEVLNKVLLGKKKILSFSDDEKKIQATYQAAKALSACLAGVGFEKITLIEDRFEEFDRHLRSKTELLNRVKVHLAGSCATLLIYNESFSNACEDLKAAKELANKALKFDLGGLENRVDLNENFILTTQRDEIMGILSPLKDKIMFLANVLLERERLVTSDVKGILEQRA